MVNKIYIYFLLYLCYLPQNMATHRQGAREPPGLLNPPHSSVLLKEDLHCEGIPRPYTKNKCIFNLYFWAKFFKNISRFLFKLKCVKPLL